MIRPAIVVALPPDEQQLVIAELGGAGFDAIAVRGPDELKALLERRRDVAVAVLDGECDLDTLSDLYGQLHEDGRDVPALMVLSPQSFDEANGARFVAVADEFLMRPFSGDSLRWRVEAMCIRYSTVDDGSGEAILSQSVEFAEPRQRGSVIAVFNAKGGVGKTTVATNLASALQLLQAKQVLLVDADTVTGHVAQSLGIEKIRTLIDGRLGVGYGGESEAFVDFATTHQSGLRLVTLGASPHHAELLDPGRIAAAIAAARSAFDYVIVDLHSSYGALNRAIFEVADRILVPVTPDLPSIRAAVQLREFAVELGFVDRLAITVNRARSGIAVAEIERTTGLPAFALIRSGGMLFVRSANEGRTVIQMFPKEGVTKDFVALAARVAGAEGAKVANARGRPGFRLLTRPREGARA